jgi:hypothetical protein
MYDSVNHFKSRRTDTNVFVLELKPGGENASLDYPCSFPVVQSTQAMDTLKKSLARLLP